MEYTTTIILCCVMVQHLVVSSFHAANTIVPELLVKLVALSENIVLIILGLLQLLLLMVSVEE